MRRTTEAVLFALAAAVAAVAVFWPLWSAKYPPITDLPFHGATSATFRHWFDDAYHARDQFELQPIAVPYLSSYVLAAFFMLFLPVVPAVKLATGVMLLSLPIGLGTLTWGMRKSPLLGLLGVPFAWCHLTHWGFIHFVAALGLYAAAAGLALRALDVPSRRTQIALGGVLVLLFFTHVFRFPFAVVAVLGAAAVTSPVHRRVRPVLLPLAPSLVLFALFWILRPQEITGELGPMALESARLDQIVPAIVDGFEDPAELASARRHLFVVLAAAAVCLGVGVARRKERTRAEHRARLRMSLVPIGSAVAFGWLYLTLPMEIGTWWYVYPREATAAAFLCLGAFPDLPRVTWLRGAVLGAASVTALGVSAVVARNYAAFEETTRDFDAVVAEIPMAPKLCYLVFDHAGSTRTTTPYIHLPAWVQAERGGWLSFHFAVFGASPLRYRADDAAVVPPPVPERWEWTPQRFDVRTHGPFFDWFLVRRAGDPRRLFRADPTIVPVARHGTWWLYRRDPAAVRAP